MNSRREQSPRRGWTRPELRVVRRVVVVSVGAFLIGYAASALWMRSGSSARTVVTVPNLRELPLSQARDEAQDWELMLETTDSLPHPEIDAGRVLMQSPLPGQEVPPGTAVQVILSSGRARHPVPQLAGLSREQAEQVLRATGMEPVVEELNDMSRAGLVVGTVPAAGSTVPVPASVRLQVSLGPPLVEVPDLVGAQEVDLPAILTPADLRLGEVVRELRLMDPEGQVMAQQPAAGDSVPAGSEVDVVVTTDRLELLDPGEIR